VLGTLRRRGTSTLSLGLPERKTGYLRSGPTGPRPYNDTASSILGATDDGFESPPRTRRHEERWPPSFYLLAVLHRPGDDDEGTDVARCLPSSGREGAIARRTSRKRRAGSGGRRIGAGSKEPSRRGERGSDARGRARASLMLLQKSTDSDRRREADALHFTRSGSVRGRAPSSQLQRTKVRGHERRVTGTLIEAETSRDRSRERVRPAHGAGSWRWKASRIVGQAALHGTPAQHGLGQLDGPS